MSDFFADRFHKTRYFVPESQWQTIDRRNAAAIVRVGVANSAGGYSDQNFGRPDLWKCNLGIFQRFTDLHELDSPHKIVIRRGQLEILYRPAKLMNQIENIMSTQPTESKKLLSYTIAE